ncbi:uncharacterized protein JN550_002274 [Neoarthrinium moseri]|uniref:uncharacterized protein n=1 Tax=Neoarthrinium moseri TaxID=1658444 RepID=UPI001FDE348B|nr:uncharacterized protein JN550_002274 [Neoarthrinium moseri]KAI1874845.1 hypothetical protein JN550_002274 [Neoarthrinium moseri]
MPLLRSIAAFISLAVLASRGAQAFILSFYLGTECHGAPWGGNHLSYNETGCGRCFEFPVNTKSAVISGEGPQDDGYDVNFWATSACNGSAPQQQPRRASSFRTLEVAADDGQGLVRCTDLAGPEDDADVVSYAICRNAEPAPVPPPSTIPPGGTDLPWTTNTAESSNATAGA